MSAQHTDVAILGGGLAGLSMALHIRQTSPDAKITVLEKQRHPVSEATHKVGESTVEVAANYFSRVLGLREHIEQEQLPKLGLRFFFPHGDNSAIEKRLEVGGRRYAPAPSYQLDRGRFENFLAMRCEEFGIQFLDEAKVADFQIQRQPWLRRRPHSIEYQRNNTTESLSARWLVDASGRRALIKRKLGLAMPSPHDCNAAWFRVGRRIKVDDWCNDPDWTGVHTGELSRWYSTNHLMGPGYWVWLIPLSSGATSVGIVAASDHHPLKSFNSLEKSLAWLDRHEPQCAAAIRENESDIQDFLAIKHYSLECRQVFSGNRWGIVGEAGFFHDPFYSPGSDFIAFANTFLADLIDRDLRGKEFRIRAFSYDKIFKKFFHGTAAAYQDQYQLFGNSRVMPIKILWDYLIYWSITCFIFMHNRQCQQRMYVRHVRKLNRLGDLNHFMQHVFREWHQRDDVGDISGLVDISNMELIRVKNEELIEELDDREFGRRFAKNVAQIETLFWEILDEVKLQKQPPFKRVSHPEAIPNGFRPAFEATRSQRSHQGRSDQMLVSPVSHRVS